MAKRDARARKRRRAILSIAPTPARVRRRVLRAGLAIFGLALAVRLLHLWQLSASPFFGPYALMGDSAGYDRWAQRIAAGDWLGGEGFYQAPLYPYVLGVIYTVAGRDLAIVRLCQALLGAGSCVLLAAAGWRFFSWRVGLVAGVLLAVYAPAIFMDATIQKSAIDLFLLCLLLWLLARTFPMELDGWESARVEGWGTRTWLGIGVALAALSLSRENALVFAVAILFWLWLERRSFAETRWRWSRAPGLLLVGMAVVLLPVAARNNAVGGGFHLTTSQFGPNFYIGNNANADGTYNPLRFGRSDPLFERDDATALAQEALDRELTPGEVSRYWIGLAIDDIAAAPVEWVRLLGRKLLLTWNAVEVVDTESQYAHQEWSLPLRVGGWVGHFGLLVPLAALGLWAGWHDRRRQRVLYLMAGLYAASIVGFYVFARYRYPLVPFVILYAAVGLVNGLASLRAVSVRVRVGCSVALLLTAIVTNWPMLSRIEMRAVTYNNLGTAFREAGNAEGALAHYETALQLMPDDARALTNLGSLLAAQGQTDQAIRRYREAITLKPNIGNVHFNFGNALVTQGRLEEAVEQYRRALEIWPSDVGAYNNLGMALGSAGRVGEAVEAFREAVRLDPTAARAHENFAVALEDLGQIDEARQHRAEAERLRLRSPGS